MELDFDTYSLGVRGCFFALKQRLKVWQTNVNCQQQMRWRASDMLLREQINLINL